MASDIVARVHRETPSGNWTQLQDGPVRSIVFEMEKPIILNGPEGDDVAKEWGVIWEDRFTDTIQVVSIDRSTPTGWTLDTLVWELEGDTDLEKAIKWMAKNYELLEYA